MKKHLFILVAFVLIGHFASAQKVEFEEYVLDNGMHVILHQDNTAPVVTTSVMYHWIQMLWLCKVIYHPTFKKGRGNHGTSPRPVHQDIHVHPWAINHSGHSHVMKWLG